jgi:hypothetical protein
MSEDVPRCPKTSRSGSEIHQDVPLKALQMGHFWDGGGTSSSTLCVECIPAAGGQRDAFGERRSRKQARATGAPTGSAGTAHRSRRRTMVSATHSRGGGATVRFRRVREPKSRRMRDRRFAIRARHPVVLLARADAEPRAARWARTPTSTSPRPRLPAFAPTSLEVWRARADLRSRRGWHASLRGRVTVCRPSCRGGTPNSCHTSADERVVAQGLISEFESVNERDHAEFSVGVLPTKESGRRRFAVTVSGFTRNARAPSRDLACVRSRACECGGLEVVCRGGPDLWLLGCLVGRLDVEGSIG